MLLSDIMTIIVAAFWFFTLALIKVLPKLAPFWCARNGFDLLDHFAWKFVIFLGTVLMIVIVLWNFWLDPYRGY